MSYENVSAVKSDKRVPKGAKLLYIDLIGLSKEKGYAWPSNDNLAKNYNVDKRTASRWVNTLKDCGYIIIDFIYGEGTNEVVQRQIRIVNSALPIDNTVYTCSQNCLYPVDNSVYTPIDKNVQDNINSEYKNNINLYSEKQPQAVKQSHLNNQIPKESKSVYKGHRRPRLGAEYGHAKFTDDEWKQLQQEFPTDYLERVRKVDTWCEQTGKEYNNYLLAIREWAKRENNKKPPEKANQYSDSRSGIDMSKYREL